MYVYDDIFVTYFPLLVKKLNADGPENDKFVTCFLKTLLSLMLL